MILSYRIGVYYWSDEEAVQRLIEVFNRHRSAVDEISLFTDLTGHGYEPLDEFARRAELLGTRVAELHAAGFESVGINMLVTLGHGDILVDWLPALPFQPMVGHDGTVSVSSPCANTPAFRAYMRERYRLIAAAHPDFIWVDDDLRLVNHGPRYVCFCPTCLALFGHGVESREQLVARLNDPAEAALRQDWVRFNEETLRSLCADIAAAVHEVDASIDVGLMTVGARLSTYAGQSVTTCMEALEGYRARPGHGFYEDSRPLDVIHKAMDVARQVRLYPVQVDNIQYELENYPYIELSKATQTLLNECALALACGCNGIAFNMLKPFAGTLEDFEARLAAIERVWPDWEALATAGQDTHQVGLWPAETPQLMARRQVDGSGWFWEGGVYDYTRPESLATLGFPLTADPAHACAALLPGRVAEAFDDDALRRMLSGGVLLDGQALQVLWARGLGELTGVRVLQAFDHGVWERFSEHAFNAPYGGDCRSTPVETTGGTAYTLGPLDESVARLSYLVRYDGQECGLCATAYENALGGRVVVCTYAPWDYLGTRPKRTQLARALRWASRERLPLWLERTVSLAPFVRVSDDGRRFTAVLLNPSFDPTGALDLEVRAHPARVTLITEAGALPLYLQPTSDGVSFTVPGVGPWRTAILLGEE